MAWRISIFSTVTRVTFRNDTIENIARWIRHYYIVMIVVEAHFIDVDGIIRMNSVEIGHSVAADFAHGTYAGVAHNVCKSIACFTAIDLGVHRDGGKGADHYVHFEGY